MRGFGLSFRLSGGIGSEGVWVVAWRGMGCERGCGLCLMGVISLSPSLCPSFLLLLPVVLSAAFHIFSLLVAF